MVETYVSPTKKNQREPTAYPAQDNNDSDEDLQVVQIIGEDNEVLLVFDITLVQSRYRSVEHDTPRLSLCWNHLIQLSMVWIDL